jgi:hypothetical protein
MDYAYAKKLFDSRRKGADFKPVYNYYRLVEVPEGLQFRYRDDKNTPIATVTPETVWTMHLDVTAQENHGKLLLRKLIGSSIYISNDSRSPFKNTLRFSVSNKDLCGYKPGLQYDAINKKVINAEPDARRTINKEAAEKHKPVFDVTKALTAALLRLGVVEDTARGLTWRDTTLGYAHALQKVRDDISDGRTIDENYDFSPLIEAALRVAIYSTEGPVQKLWSSVQQHYVEYTVPDWHGKVIDRARSKLNKDLRMALGVYEYVTEQKGN